MSQTYIDLIHSNFPESVSSLLDIRDPYASEIPLLNQYNTYMAKGNTNAAEQLLADNPNLQKCIINAYILLKLDHDIIAVQRTFNDNVNGYITKMKNDSIKEIQDIESEYSDKVNSKYQSFSDKIDNTNAGIDTKVADAIAELQTAADNFEDYILGLSSYQGEFNPKVTYKKFQVVSYKIGETTNSYMVVADSTIGNLPTSDSFIPLTLKGDKGETGTGLTPRGVYDPLAIYYVNDMVSYNHELWFAKSNEFSGKTPSNGSTYWESFFILSQSSEDINLNNGTTLQTYIENLEGNIENINENINILSNSINVLEDSMGGIKFSVENGILCCTYDDGQ